MRRGLALRKEKLELARDAEFANGSCWVFDYEDVDADPEEPLSKLDRHTLVQGEYISILEHDGVQRTFKVAFVR